MLYIIGIGITFFLSLLLLTKKNKSDADNILTFWLLITGLHLVLFYLHLSGNYVKFPYLLGFEIALPFVHTPFIYLYIASLTNQTKNRQLRFLHFVPIIIVYLIVIDFFFLSYVEKIAVYKNSGLGYNNRLNFIFYAFIIQGFTYIILSYKKLIQHKKNILSSFSSIEKINLNWLRYLLLGNLLIWLSIFTTDETTFTLVVLFVIFIGYFGINQVGIFNPNEKTLILISETNEATPFASIPPENEVIENEIDAKLQMEDTIQNIKYQKSTLTPERAQEIHQQLLTVLQNEKLYKNPEITLAELAEKLTIAPNHLSQVINTIEQKNFFDFINQQRVEEFKRIVHLSENHQFTFLSLAFASGFNSKTSFNRNFKKATGYSPSEYLKLENIQLLD